MDIIFLGAIYFFVLAAVANVKQTWITRHRPLQDKNVASAVISASIKHSRIACAIACARSTKCASFFYRSMLRECQLHADTFMTPEGATEKKGLQYYYIIKAHRCPTEKAFKLLAKSTLCVKFHTDIKSWYKAKRICESYCPGSRLVVLDNKRKNELVKAAGRKIHGYNEKFGRGVWIGLSEYSVNKYRWVNGKQTDYNDWGKRDVSNPSQHDCALFYRPDHWRWTRESCYIWYHYICEVQLDI